MATNAQLQANRANARLSTGPQSAAGRATSAQNAVSHGLTASEESLSSLSNENQMDFDHLRNKLRPQLQPKGELEEQIFGAYCWSLFQAERARAFEAYAQSAWELDMEDDAKLRRMERLAIYRQRHERAAERGLKELGRIQRDRFASNQANKVLQSMGFPDKKLSAALPAFELQSKRLRRGNHFSVANDEMMGYPQTPPPHPGDGLSPELKAQFERLAKSMGQAMSQPKGK